MEMMARVRAWCARESTRTLLWDTLLAAALIAGCVPFNGVTSPDSTGGILFPATQASMTLWSLPVFVPLMLRRYRPEPAAWLFVALTITPAVTARLWTDRPGAMALIAAGPSTGDVMNQWVLPPRLYADIAKPASTAGSGSPALPPPA